jgi:hypothetical protein
VLFPRLRRHALLPGVDERQFDRKRGAVSFAATVRFDRAAVDLDEVTRDRQAETKTAVMARRRAVSLTNDRRRTA